MTQFMQQEEEQAELQLLETTARHPSNLAEPTVANTQRTASERGRILDGQTFGKLSLPLFSSIAQVVVQRNDGAAAVGTHTHTHTYIHRESDSTNPD